MTTDNRHADAALCEELGYRVSAVWKRLIVDAGTAQVRDATSHAMAALDLAVEHARERIEELSSLLAVEREARKDRSPF